MNKPGPDLLAKTNPFLSELFARGYIFRSSKPPVVPEGWVHGRFGDFFYAHDKRLKENQVSEEGAALLCLGVLNDVRHPHQSTEACCGELLAALRESEDSFFEELAYTCGRYVLISERKGQYSLVTDATGMKSAYYYNRETRIISSHVNLIRWNGEDAKPAENIALKFGYPGIRTPVSNTFLLTPNSKLDTQSMSPSRFWPKKAIEPRSLEDAVELSGAYLKGAFDHYRAFYEPVISVTAGLDSRLTLALARGAENTRLFTYYRSDSMDDDGLDRSFARTFSEISGQDVDILELRNMNPAPDAFSAVQNENKIFNHIRSLAWIYYDKFGADSDVIHVRSNISEVGREFWKGKKFPITSGKDLARVYLYGDKNYKAKYIFDVIERFEEFDAIVGLTACRDLVDIKSLFYWEFRMASWHAGVVAESDSGFDTVSVYNCRKTLEVMLSVDQKSRRDSLILRNVIARQWPELSNHEVNGKPFWPDAPRSRQLPPGF